MTYRTKQEIYDFHKNLKKEILQYAEKTNNMDLLEDRVYYLFPHPEKDNKYMLVSQEVEEVEEERRKEKKSKKVSNLDIITTLYSGEELWAFCLKNTKTY